MKIITKENAKRVMSLVLSFVMAFSVMMPAFAVVEALPFGTVEALTDGLAAEGTDEILVTNKEEIKLEYVKADPSIGRMNDGWWAGFKVIAPAGLTEEELKTVEYRKNTDGQWSEPGLFWDVKNSSEGDASHWVGVWVYVTPEKIAEAAEGKLTYSYEFDWYGNGFDGEVQKINVVLDTDKINLDMAPFLGQVKPITNGLTAEGEQEVVVTNKEEITLSFSKANPAIGRMKDGWWAGIKVIAPSDLTVEELKKVKYLRTDAKGTSEKIFWNVKDSADTAAVHYIEMWVMATPELIAADDDGKLTTTYVFDWYGNGFDGEVQKIDFVLDTDKINLDMAPFLGQAEAITKGLSAEGTDEILVTNKEEITLEFAKADPSIGRMNDGWWAGFKVIAPAGLTEEELKTVKFRKNTDGQWSEPGLFWDVKNSAEGDAAHWVGVWTYVTPEKIAEASEGKLTYSYEFDWYGNGFEGEVQKINVVLDTEKLVLDTEHNYGTATAFTDGIEISGETDIYATNKEEVTLSFHRADPSAYRFYDGWWAGIRVFAPAELTSEQIKNAKYRKWNGTGWGTPAYFRDLKDSKDDAPVQYFDSWMCVTPDIIKNDADGKLTLKYEFDWDGNGFGISTQVVEFVLDVTKINLDMTPFLGQVKPITNGLAAEGEQEVVVTNKEEITLSFSKANPAIGRMKDGWWAGIKVIAPSDLTVEELKKVKYLRTDAKGTSEKIFWNVKDSADTAAVHYIEMWVMATPELIAADDDGKLTTTYVFDWYGNGFDGEVQKIDFVLDTDKINLDHENYYGSVEGITQGIEATGTTDIEVTNAQEITLDFAPADPSIGRMKDGWWAGFKVTAPAELTEAQLKDVKFRKNTDGNWSEPGLFWDVKNSAEGDASHWVGVWAFVTPELIASAQDNKIIYEYEFDWDGNGFGISTQKVKVVLDTEKINLDMTPFLGQAEAITDGLAAEGTDEILVTNKEEIKLEYVKADPSIGRMNDGWWAGFKVIAPAGLTEEELKTVEFRKNTDGQWSEPGLFWDVKNSSEGDAVHWVGVWVYVTPEKIAEAAEGKLTYSYEFDWYGNGFDGEVQKINVVLDTEKINLDMTPFLGQAEAITDGLAAEGTDEILVTNKEEIKLEYVKADPSIGRMNDGWWAGFKVIAPAGLTEEELKTVKFRKNTDGQWSEPGLFWDVKNSAEGDASHWVGVWVYVTPEKIAEAAEGKLTYSYEFDWYGNGFESAVQKINVVLDTDKINLDHENYYGSVEGITQGVEATGTTDIEVTNAQEITLDFAPADPSIGRMKDGWWAGFKVTAPAELTEAQLKDVKFRKNTDGNWSEPGYFWDVKNSAEGDAVHWVGVWAFVTPELIASAQDNKIIYEYEFDWDGNGFGISTQKVKVVLDTEKIKLIHSEGCEEVIDEARVEPDCENAGREAKSHCYVCGLVISDGKEIPALGHTDGEAVIENNTAPDCENDGSYDTVVYCTVCEKQLSRVTTTVDALGHTDGEAVIENDVTVTCEKDGSYDTVVYCTVCEKQLSRVTTTIPAPGHTDGEAVIENDVAVTCEKDGSYDTVVYCTVCQQQLSRVTTTIPAPGHDYSEKIIDEKHLYKEKTCTTYAKYFYDCVRCDDMTSETFENIEEGLLEHKKTLRVSSRYLASPADCENQAWYYMGCLTCDTIFKDEKVDKDSEGNYIEEAKGHLLTVEKVTTKASIGKKGYTNFFCEDCDKMDSLSLPFPAIKSVQLSGTSYSYTGKAIKPSVTVKDTEGKTLKNGTDYTVTYSSNTAPGKASVKVTFKGSYTGSTTLSFTIKQLPATKKITFTSTTSSITLKWDKVANADGYKVYIKTSKGWKEIGSTTKNSLKVTKTSAGKSLSSGKEYSFMVKAYAKPDSKTYVSDAYKSITAATMAAATSKVSVSQTTSSVTLSWKKVSGADKYNVYKYNTKTKKYELYKTVKDTKITIKKLKSGTSYKYLIRAVTVISDSVSVLGAEKKLTASTKPATPKISLSAKGTTATLKWKSITGASGYEVYMKGSGKTKLIGTVKSSKTSFTQKKLKKGTKYTFSVRAYRTVDGKKIYSDYAKKAVTIK